ncbi:MAG: hypothetical protein JOY90_04425 [Bradyrhizobium sp.]|uniref:hypothetical protein n=1 Tax=Bradyrhizobium sp. TaxID=376 RepID=UPI001DBC1C3E|nr:hypothetical protein [Bradyrhizobium sp.]MBV9559695.1 hypothetical protein [Bradyrhizobium sp.]
MKTRVLVAATFLISLSAGPALAQSAPSNDSGASPPPASTPAPAPAPAATPEPAPAAAPAAPAAAESTDKAAPADKAAETEQKTTAKKRKTARAGSRRELEHSIESGTVPSRYRSQVPREYQKYIPFDR